jgi:hypothetical protein
MNTSVKDEKLTLGKVEYTQMAIFGVVCLLIIILGFNYFKRLLLNGNFKTQAFVAVISIFLIAGICNGLWKILGSTSLFVENGFLCIKRQIFLFAISRKYAIEHISNLKLGDKANSSFYWGFAGIRVYNKVSCLSFDYEGNTKQIKGSLSESDFNLLKQWIRG